MTSRGSINNKNDFRAGFPPNGSLIPPSSNNMSNYSQIAKVKLISDGIATLTNGNLTGLNNLEVDTITVNNVVIDHITFPNLNANTALILDSNKELTSSITTSIELSYVHGVTSSIQNQIDSKTGTANILGTTNQIDTVPSGNNIIVSISNDPIIPGTGGITWPSGNTSQRTGIAGTTRFNSEMNVFEGTTDGSTWSTFTSSATSITSVTASAPLSSSGGNNPDISLTGIVNEINGGTGQSTYTLGDILYSSATDTLSKLPGNTTTTKQYLSQTGTGINSTAPSWSTISGSDITGAALTKVDDTNVTLTLGGTPATALLQATSITAGWTGTLSPTRGGTGVNNGTNTLTLGGDLTTSGVFASTFTMTGITTVTFPTSGTLATTTTPASTITLANDTTNQSDYLVFSNGATGSQALKTNANVRVNPDTTTGGITISNTTASTSNTTGAITIAGGIGISNTTDATSTTNGGSFTTAGGMAVAKQLYVGTTIAANRTNVFTTYRYTFSTGSIGNGSTAALSWVGSFSVSEVIPYSGYITVYTNYNGGSYGGGYTSIAIFMGWNTYFQIINQLINGGIGISKDGGGNLILTNNTGFAQFFSVIITPIMGGNGYAPI